MYHCGCHRNLFITATRYVADAYHNKELHAKYGINRTQDIEVIKVDCGCHGNLVTIVTRNVANVCCPQKALY